MQSWLPNERDLVASEKPCRSHPGIDPHHLTFDTHEVSKQLYKWQRLGHLSWNLWVLEGGKQRSTMILSSNVPRNYPNLDLAHSIPLGSISFFLWVTPNRYPCYPAFHWADPMVPGSKNSSAEDTALGARNSSKEQWSAFWESFVPIPRRWGFGLLLFKTTQHLRAQCARQKCLKTSGTVTLCGVFLRLQAVLAGWLAPFRRRGASKLPFASSMLFQGWSQTWLGALLFIMFSTQHSWFMKVVKSNLIATRGSSKVWQLAAKSMCTASGSASTLRDCGKALQTSTGVCEKSTHRSHSCPKPRKWNVGPFGSTTLLLLFPCKSLKTNLDIGNSHIKWTCKMHHQSNLLVFATLHGLVPWLQCHFPRGREEGAVAIFLGHKFTR